MQVAGIARIMVGGEHERWEVPRRVDAEEELGWGGEEADGEGGGSSSVDADGRPRRQHGQAPKVGVAFAPGGEGGTATHAVIV